jgi:hypothetical protein
LNAEPDIDTYERLKTFGDYDPSSPDGWRPKKTDCYPGTFIREYEVTLSDGSKETRSITLKETDTIKKAPREEWYTDKDKHCESLEEFTKRRWGGASLARIDASLLETERKYRLYAFTRRQARSEIFDIRGRKALTVAEPNANSFKARMGRREGLDAIARRELRTKQALDNARKNDSSTPPKTAEEHIKAREDMIAQLESSRPPLWQNMITNLRREILELRSYEQAARLTQEREAADRSPRGYASPTARKLTVYRGDYVHRSFLDRRDYQWGGFDRSLAGFGRIGKARLSTWAIDDDPLEGTVRPTNDTPFHGLDYFKLNPPILTQRRWTPKSGGLFTINGDLDAKGRLISIEKDDFNQVQKNQDSLLPPRDQDVLSPLPPFCGDTKATYTYKTLSSVVKNTSPTETELK